VVVVRLDDLFASSERLEILWLQALLALESKLTELNADPVIQTLTEIEQGPLELAL
jgi:hypothetical protein